MINAEPMEGYCRIILALVCIGNLHITMSIPCSHNSSCVLINTTMCLTANVTFNQTSLAFTNNRLTQHEIIAQLEVWSQLRGVPECWNVIQPFLCSVYLPKCDKNSVEMPNRELCERVRAPCEVIKLYNGSWPWFLDCDQWFYAKSCGQTVFETANFDTSSTCTSPLVETPTESNWYDKVKGCGLQCKNSLFTQSEHTAVHVLVGIMGTVCLLSTLFTMATFSLDWKVARKYPAVILFYINGCFFIATLGWMAQFINRQDITCRKDGTIRKGEPLIGNGESASCTVVFIIIYYFLMAGIAWYVMLAYSWHIHFKALGTVRDDLSKKTSYFHICCWCFPLVLTIVCLSVSVIDADSLSGICFPGFYHSWIRAGFVIVPVCVVLVVGALFSIRGLVTLIKVRKDSPPFVGDKAMAKINDTINRLFIFIALTFCWVIVSLGIHIYSFVSVDNWDNSLMEYTYCRANVSVMQILDNAAPSSCEMGRRPSIVATMIHIFAFFGAGLTFSSWSWTKASLEVWKRFYRRLCNKPINQPQKLRRHHRLVAKAFKRRKQRSKEGMSLSYGTDGCDPVGMRFDRSSASSNSMSSGFTMTMPKLHRHHHRLRHHHTRQSHKKHSDSDAASLGSRITTSQRPSTRSSRRQSYESSMSQKLSDIEREIREEERFRRRQKKWKKRQNRIQPIMEPISSSMAAIQARRRRHLYNFQRHPSDSSDVSKLSAAQLQKGIVDTAMFPMQSLGTSDVLSESVTDGNSISEIELPHAEQKLPDFSMFTTGKLALPEMLEDNANGNMSNLKNGANPSPSGSIRRGRRREVKLEFSETSIYQEDSENIEIGGNQTFHIEENCHEMGEISAKNMKELGPLVNEIFEHARANSSDMYSSSQRDPMGSSRLNSASSKGSRGSKGSHSNSRDFKYANTKVHLPPEVPRNNNTQKKRPFSGDYILHSRKKEARPDSEVRKSKSQPGSRVSSANDHKRQIGHNGRLEFGDGVSWSRFLQGKGHLSGNLFGQPQTFDKGCLTHPIFDKNHFHTVPHYYESSKSPFVGHLQIAEKPYFENPATAAAPEVINTCLCDPSSQSIIDIKRPYTNPYRKDSTEGDVLANINETHNAASQVDEPVNVLNVEAEHFSQCGGCGLKPPRNVDVLNIEAEHVKESVESVRVAGGHSGKINVLNIEEEHKKKKRRQKYQPNSKLIVNTDVLNAYNEHESSKIDNLNEESQGTKHQNDNSYCHGEHLAEESAIRNTKNLGIKNDSKPQKNIATQLYQDDRKHKPRMEVAPVSAFSGVVVTKNDQSEPISERTIQELPRDKQTVSTVAKHIPDEIELENNTKFVAINSRQRVSERADQEKQANTLTRNASVDKIAKPSHEVSVEGKNKPGVDKTGSRGVENLSNIDHKHAINISENQDHMNKKEHMSLFSGSKSCNARTDSGPGKPSINNQNNENHNDSGFVTSARSQYDNKTKDPPRNKILPAEERSVGMFDFVDYDLDSEYDDVTTDDLTDTYTYTGTSCDDDLTEVSSLPC